METHKKRFRKKIENVEDDAGGLGFNGRRCE